ncbi:MAG: TRAP transporter small permease [Rhodobacteraceae bacterium]|nr:TRAP transporter small permease [Paracoccaceae bacterium]
MTTSSVLSDHTELSRFDRALFRLESTLNLLGGLTIFALVGLAVVHVVSRKLLNAPVPGYVDWTEQFMAIFAFLGLAYTQREGGHIRMDILLSALKGRRLWLAEWLSTLFMLLLTTALIYGTYFHFARSFDLNAPLFSRDSSIDIALPLWPAKLVVTISMCLLWLRLSLQLWAYGRAFIAGKNRPVAVPLIETAAEAANREAHSVEGADE